MLRWLRRRRITLSFLVVLLLVSSALYESTQNAPITRADPDHTVIAKGRYLASVICAECHTVRAAGDPFTLDATMLFAGGEKFELPFGTVYSSNLTSDEETGLGSWTAAEIKRAIRDGIAEDGQQLVLMPWESFHGLAEEDLDAIVAYLQSLPAISYAVPEAELRVLREALYAEAAKAAQSPGGARAPTGRDSPSRGGYLVKNLLGCQGCHGATLAGGVPPFFAPNLTSDRATGIGNWSKEDIVRAVREGVRPDRRRLAPVMPAATAYRNLTDDDMYNVIAYLRSIPALPKGGAGPQPAPSEAGGS